MKAVTVLVPQGVGDSAWCIPKLRALRRQYGAAAVDLRIACWNTDNVEMRAREFLRQFKIVRSVEMYLMPRLEGQEAPLLLPGPAADARGHYRYFPDGPARGLKGIDYVLIPNNALEKGIRLEDWRPGLETDWNFMDDFNWEGPERLGDEALERLSLEHGCFAVFFLGCIYSNGAAGHNRCGLWSPFDWVSLGDALYRKLGLSILVVGAEYDRSYYQEMVKPLVKNEPHWINTIGQWPINTTLAVIDAARMMMSYQSGLGIMSHYMRTPTAMWWRPKGNSISPATYVSPDEAMTTAWNYPDAGESFLPLIYGRESVGDIVAAIERRGW